MQIMKIIKRINMRFQQKRKVVKYPKEKSKESKSILFKKYSKT